MTKTKLLIIIFVSNLFLIQCTSKNKKGESIITKTDTISTPKVKTLIKKLPNGLKTNIGENGIKLSGGQRQRIAIARAFYRDSKLLIFDEATSALDNKTESDVMKAISKMNKKMTIIFIAHRLSTVKDCDCIFEFGEGQIIAKGTYEELLERSPSFNKLINANKFY